MRCCTAFIATAAEQQAALTANAVEKLESFEQKSG